MLSLHTPAPSRLKDFLATGAAACALFVASQLDAASFESAKPVLERYCYECHGSEEQSAELNLEQVITSPVSLQNHPSTLEDILWMVEEGEMPPRKSEQPSKEDRELLLGYLHHLQEDLLARNANDPGRVVMPRLTRRQYANAIRDLTGVEIDAGRFFTDDGRAGEGFDNVGEAQTLTTGQFEKYLQAATYVLRHGLFTPSTIVWNETPYPQIESSEDLRENLIGSIRTWYGTNEAGGSHQGAINRKFDGGVHAAYLEAAYRYHHREALGLGDATIDAVARSFEPELLGVVLEEWYALLMAEHGNPLLRRFVSKWRALPPPRSDADVKQLRPQFADLDDECDALTGVSGQEFEEELEREQFVHLFGQARHQPPPESHRERKELTKAFIDRGIRPLGYKVGPVDKLYLMTTNAGDGSEDDLIIWGGGVFFMEDGSRRPWHEIFPEGLETVDGRKISWRTSPAGLELAEDEIAVTAPAALVLPIPEGAKEFYAFPRASEFAPNGSVQTFMHTELPSADRADLFFTDQRKGLRIVWGAPGSERVRRFEHHRGQFDGHFRTAGKHDFQYRGTILEDLTEIDSRYLGGPWEEAEFDRAEPMHPYHFDCAKIRRVAGPEALERLEQLQRALVSAAQPTLQDLARAMEHAGVKGYEEGRLPTDEEVNALAAETGAKSNLLIQEAQQELARQHEKAREFLEPFAARTWGRPLQPGEIGMLTDLYKKARTEGDSYHSALSQALRVALVSPHFVFRVPETGRQALEPIGQYDLAGRLAAFLWGSLPDRELLNLAYRGELAGPAVLVKQTRRMLQDPKAQGLAEEFTGQWLDFAGFEAFGQPDREVYPAWSQELAEAMHQEALHFFTDLIRHDRPVTQILEADYTFLNEALAEFYGLERVDGGEFRKVRVAEVNRGGLLGMGAFLTGTSSARRTSPVLRGVYLLEQILGEHLPEPPPNVPQLSDDQTSLDGLTVTEQLAVHRAKPECSGCHNRIDPLGVALENFDGIGRWRDEDANGRPVANEGRAVDGTKLDGVGGLRQYLLKNRTAFVQHFCRKLLGYALGRPLNVGDRPLLEAMEEALQTHDYRFSAAVETIVTSRQFLLRRNHPEPQKVSTISQPEPNEL